MPVKIMSLTINTNSFEFAKLLNPGQEFESSERIYSPKYVAKVLDVPIDYKSVNLLYKNEIIGGITNNEFPYCVFARTSTSSESNFCKKYSCLLSTVRSILREEQSLISLDVIYLVKNRWMYKEKLVTSKLPSEDDYKASCLAAEEPYKEICADLQRKCYFSCEMPIDEAFELFKIMPANSTIRELRFD